MGLIKVINFRLLHKKVCKVAPVYGICCFVSIWWLSSSEKLINDLNKIYGVLIRYQGVLDSSVLGVYY